MSKSKLPPVNQVEIFAGNPADVKKALAVLLATPGLSVQTMLQTESAAYSSLNQAIERSVTVTVVFRQYEIPADPESAPANPESAPTGEETVVLPREGEAKEASAPSHGGDQGGMITVDGGEGAGLPEAGGEHPGITDMPDNAAEHP